MPDLRTTLERAGKVPAPDLWDDVERRSRRPDPTVPGVDLDAAPPRSSGQRLLAAVVAFAVFGLAGSFAWSAFSGDRGTTIGSPIDLPVFSARFTSSGANDDGPDRRVGVALSYGDTSQESFTSTLPQDEVVEWAAAEDLTRFVPGPTAGSAVQLDADGEDPRVLIGTPEQWPGLDRFEQVDALPTDPGSYVVVFEVDYPEGTARLPLMLDVAARGTLQLVLVEGGQVDPATATATAHVDGVSVPGALTESSFIVSDIARGSAPPPPDLDSMRPIVVEPDAPIVVRSSARRVTAALLEGADGSGEKTSIDLAASPSVPAVPGDHALAVGATWQHGESAPASEATRELARFLFPIRIETTEDAALPDPEVADDPPTGSVAPEPPSPGPDQGEPDVVGVPDVLRVTCTSQGTDLGSSRVRPQPDGVHVVIDNPEGLVDGAFHATLLGRQEGVFATFTKGLDPGANRIVWGFPPGEIFVGCFPLGPSFEADAFTREDLLPLEVVDAEGYYVSNRLTCQEGVEMDGFRDDAGALSPVAPSPEEAVRAYVPGILPDDEILRAIYPGAVGNRAPAYVVVRRAEDTLAWLKVTDHGGRWGVHFGYACPGSGLGGA